AGRPIDVAIEATLPPAPLRCKHDVLNYIAALLDSAAASLSAGGSRFPFALPAGFSGFDTPAAFLEFNRGLAAKTNVYLAFRNYPAAPDLVALDSADTALAHSFMTQDPSLSALDSGPTHNYGTASGDAVNSLFDADTSSTTYVANPRV